MRHAPISIAARACSISWMHSSKQIGVSSWRCKLRVRINIVPAQRLLDHDQVKRIQLLQKWRILQPICRVGIHHQTNARKTFAKRPRRLHIHARLDFDFDALVTRRQAPFQLSPISSSIVGWMPIGHAARNLLAHSAEKFGQRNILLLGFSVPDRCLKSALRHIVPANTRKQVPNFRRATRVPCPSVSATENRE